MFTKPNKIYCLAWSKNNPYFMSNDKAVLSYYS